MWVLEVTKMIADFKQLRVWEESAQLTEDVYRLTKEFPVEEKYNFTAQLRSAALSISSNIAEGCGRGTIADFKRFLYNAQGSCKELESQLLLAQRLKIDEGRITNELIERTRKVQAMRYKPVRNTKERWANEDKGVRRRGRQMNDNYARASSKTYS